MGYVGGAVQTQAGELDGYITIPAGASSYETYSGAYTVQPSGTGTTLNTAGKLLKSNITVLPTKEFDICDCEDCDCIVVEDDKIVITPSEEERTLDVGGKIVPYDILIKPVERAEIPQEIIDSGDATIDLENNQLVIEASKDGDIVLPTAGKTIPYDIVIRQNTSSAYTLAVLNDTTKQRVIFNIDDLFPKESEGENNG